MKIWKIMIKFCNTWIIYNLNSKILKCFVKFLLDFSYLPFPNTSKFPSENWVTFSFFCQKFNNRSIISIFEILLVGFWIDRWHYLDGTSLYTICVGHIENNKTSEAAAVGPLCYCFVTLAIQMSPRSFVIDQECDRDGEIQYGDPQLSDVWLCPGVRSYVCQVRAPVSAVLKCVWQSRVAF